MQGDSIKKKRFHVVIWFSHAPLIESTTQVKLEIIATLTEIIAEKPSWGSVMYDNWF